MGGGGAAPNSAELGSLTPRLPVLLPHAEGLPPIPTVGLCTSSRAGPPRRPCARVPCRKDSECCSSSLVGAGLCPRRWQEAFTRTSVLAGGKQTDLRPRYRGLGVTDLPTGPWGGTAGWQTRGIPAPAEHKYRGELYEVDGVIGQKWLNTIRKVEWCISRSMQFNRTV